MASLIIKISVLLQLALASPLEKRAAGNTCVSDNVLRALQVPSRTADSYPFCSKYIGRSPTSTKYAYTVSNNVVQLIVKP